MDRGVPGDGPARCGERDLGRDIPEGCRTSRLSWLRLVSFLKSFARSLVILRSMISRIVVGRNVKVLGSSAWSNKLIRITFNCLDLRSPWQSGTF
jgi:hypothetical protein